MKQCIYENELVSIEIETSEIPWLKIFTKDENKEFSDCTKRVRMEVWHLLDVIEREMLAYYRPKKINIASFANYLPKVHWHVMARFESDSYFPEPMWGVKQREADLQLPSMEVFVQRLIHEIENSGND